jgi:hypothetical protein
VTAGILAERFKIVSISIDKMLGEGVVNVYIPE